MPSKVQEQLPKNIIQKYLFRHDFSAETSALGLILLSGSILYLKHFIS